MFVLIQKKSFQIISPKSPNGIFPRKPLYVCLSLWTQEAHPEEGVTAGLKQNNPGWVII